MPNIVVRIDRTSMVRRHLLLWILSRLPDLIICVPSNSILSKQDDPDDDDDDVSPRIWLCPVCLRGLQHTVVRSILELASVKKRPTSESWRGLAMGLYYIECSTNSIGVVCFLSSKSSKDYWRTRFCRRCKDGGKRMQISMRHDGLGPFFGISMIVKTATNADSNILPKLFKNDSFLYDGKRDCGHIHCLILSLLVCIRIGRASKQSIDQPINQSNKQAAR
jgi:hypothetical protein